MRSDKSTLSKRRLQAKIGMSAALGTLVASGLMTRTNTEEQNKRARLVHMCAGFALVGFSYWHWTLYQRDRSSKGRFL